MKSQFTKHTSKRLIFIQVKLDQLAEFHTFGMISTADYLEEREYLQHERAALLATAQLNH